MPDTIRTQAALQTLCADNTTGAITPQVLRDFIVSAQLHDGSGNVTATSFTGNLTGSATSAGTITGNIPESQVTNLVSDLALKSSVASLTAHTASTTAVHGSTAANTANTIVQRDGSGNFSAAVITAALTGTAAHATTAVSATTISGSISENQVVNLVGDLGNKADLGGNPFFASVSANVVAVGNASFSYPGDHVVVNYPFEAANYLRVHNSTNSADATFSYSDAMPGVQLDQQFRLHDQLTIHNSTTGVDAYFAYAGGMNSVQLNMPLQVQNSLTLKASIGTNQATFAYDGSVGYVSLNNSLKVASQFSINSTTFSYGGSGTITLDNAFVATSLTGDGSGITGSPTFSNVTGSFTGDGTNLTGNPTFNSITVTGRALTFSYSNAINGSYTPNASLANQFDLQINGDCVMATPTSPQEGQGILYNFYQNSAGTITWDGSGYNFGPLTMPTIASNTNCYVATVYNANRSQWQVLSIANGY